MWGVFTEAGHNANNFALVSLHLPRPGFQIWRFWKTTYTPGEKRTAGGPKMIGWKMCLQNVSHFSIIYVKVQEGVPWLSWTHRSKPSSSHYPDAPNVCICFPTFRGKWTHSRVNVGTPLKIDMSPQKGTISIGNTSSNHWFSGDMLVFSGVNIQT